MHTSREAMMGKRKGVMFGVPLVATETQGKINIEPDPKGPNWKHWDPKANTLTFSKDAFKDMERSDHHYVEFTLVDDATKAGIRFPRNPENAMWVVNQARCPGPKDKCEYDVMRPLAVIGEDTLLAVNFNTTKGQTFGFTLNFVEKTTADDTNPGNFIPWDPIGSNEDGGQ